MNTIELQNWPPPYTLRRSTRARQIILQITPSRGLEIVIPQYRQRFNIPKILEEKRGWIEKMLKKMVFNRQHFFNLQNASSAGPFPLNGNICQSVNGTNLLNPFAMPHHLAPRTLALPQVIDCPAIAETWKIVYQPKAKTQRVRLIALHSPEKILHLTGNTEDKTLCQRALMQWLIQKAHIHLIPWLEELSALTQFRFQRAIIRGQTTLWGSCNSRKTISLNYKLLFLPKKLAQHVLLHELCHIQYLNHSEKFWKLLEKWDSECSYHKKILKKAECYLPHWIDI